MTRTRTGRVVLGVVVACGLLGGVVPFGAAASAEGGCTNYPAFSGLASAAGLRSVQSAPQGVTLVTTADASLPAAQASLDSVTGSIGWAGAPYSETVADNLGAVKQKIPQAPGDANEVPVSVRSDYPSVPESSKSTAAVTLKAASEEFSSKASAVGGGPSSDQASAGRSTSTTAASCSEDGMIEAVADNAVDMIAVEGVLRIGSVRSHAKRVVDSTGQTKLVEDTMAVEAATVLGQPVAITEKGVVTGSSTTPLPENPLTKALADAGITVRYVAGTKNDPQGEVFAPGLEITVARSTGVGTGPTTTTYVLGRAYVRVTLPPGNDVPVVDGAPGADFGVTADIPPGTGAALVAPTPPESAAPGPVAAGPASQASTVTATDRPHANALTVRIANASIAPAYSALGIGVLLLLAGWLVLEKIAVRFRWR